MDEYREMYLKLFNEMTTLKRVASEVIVKAAEICYRVKVAQAATEEIFLKAGEEEESGHE